MINYEILADSINYYNIYNFNRIEVPWMVSKFSNSVTNPSNYYEYEYTLHNKLALVGSAEQSFIELYKDNYLPKGKFQAITPCFRQEDEYDLLHNKWFIKNELISTINVNEEELENIVNFCHKFFSKYVNCEIIKTEDGYDIISNGHIELGSYGIRRTPFLSWIYATGCAEPRLTLAINEQNFKK